MWILILAVGIAACGGGGSDAGTSADTTTDSSAPSAAEVESAGEDLPLLSDAGPPKTEQLPPEDAYELCTDAVAGYLKSPATAQFPDLASGDVRVEEFDEGTAFGAHVDSENSFGALTRSKFACAVRDGFLDGLTIDGVEVY